MQIICILLTVVLSVRILTLMTKRRQQLLQLFEQSETPLNAGQVFKQLNTAADLATIYRGLQYLEQQEYLESFVFDCSRRGIERYYVLRSAIHSHYMHCVHCHTFILLDSCPFEHSFKAIESRYGFIVSEHFITLKGVCSSCRIEKEE